MSFLVKIMRYKSFIFPCIILFALFATALFYVRSKKYTKLYMYDVFRKWIPVLIGAGIGARLLSAITLLPIAETSFLHNVTHGGAVFYGGIIGSCISLCLSCWRNKQSYLDYSDVLVSLLPLGHAIGRIGCYFNGCCYGCKYKGLLSVPYIVDGQRTRVFPAWFIEIIFCLALFGYFLFLCKTRRRGFRTAIYFISYAAYRFGIEFVRGDDVRGYFGCLSSSQWISVFMLAQGILIWIYCMKNNVNNYLFEDNKKE